MIVLKIAGDTARDALGWQMARKQLRQMERAQAGWRRWLLPMLGLLALLALLGLAGASDLDAIDSQTGCGWVQEEGLAVPGSCYSEEELGAMLEQIRAERDGERQWNTGGTR